MAYDAFPVACHPFRICTAHSATQSLMFTPLLNHDLNPERYEDQLESELQQVDVDFDAGDHAWTIEERTEDQARRRREHAATDFWAFDSIYFPPSIYRQGYSEPGDFHRTLAEHGYRKGLWIELAARKHGKSVTLKKLLAWLLLTDRVRLAATLSQTLPTSRNILDDVKRFIRDNPRISYDYEPEFEVDNDDAFTFTTRENGRPRHCQVFSEGRSLRGYGKAFDRPEWVLCDDLETQESSITDHAVQKRAKFLAESYSSMSSNGTMMVAANNFERGCLMNRLLKREQANTLPDDWHVNVYPAWTDERGPLWPERFPAQSKRELREMLDPFDEEEWSGDYQQNPQPPSGRFFKRKHYTTYSGEIPARARGILYCDPNLAKKGRGDTTAMLALFYDAAQDRFLVPYARCQSYDDSSQLLDDALTPKAKYRHRLVTVGFDGHVTQESTWTNNVRHWAKQNNAPYPQVTWCRYKVNDLAKNAQMAWQDRRIAFHAGFSETEEGQRFLTQVYAFSGKKKASGTDDAPDALICAFELIHDRLSVRPGQSEASDPIVIHDPISF